MRRFAAILLLCAGPITALAQDATDSETAIVAWRYTVQPGDTFAAIARRMGVTMQALGAFNEVPPPYIIRVGQVLRRPDPVVESHRTVPVRRPAPAPRPRPEPAHVREAGAPRLSWPTSGAIISRFGVPVKNQPNNGIDLAAYEGMRVTAAAPGKVLFAGTEPERFGQLIVIDHGGGWVTAYAYLGKVTVKDGQIVKAHQQIARIGRSGEAKKPTLHFELRRDNAPRDPYIYLPVRL